MSIFLQQLPKSDWRFGIRGMLCGEIRALWGFGLKKTSYQVIRDAFGSIFREDYFRRGETCGTEMTGAHREIMGKGKRKVCVRGKATTGRMWRKRRRGPGGGINEAIDLSVQHMSVILSPSSFICTQHKHEARFYLFSFA